MRLEKPSSSCTSPGAQAVLLCSDCFGWHLLPKPKKEYLLCPSPSILRALHIQGLRPPGGLSASSFLSFLRCSPPAFLPPCLPSWQAAPGCSLGIHSPGLSVPRLSPMHKPTSGQLCLFLTTVCPSHLLLSIFMKHNQCWSPMVLPCLCLLPTPCQPQHFGESGCLSSSSSLPVSILSLPDASPLPVCPGIKLTFAALNSALVIHPLPSPW